MLVLLIVSSALLIGCGDSASSLEPDSGPYADTGTSADTGTEIETGTEIDTGTDTQSAQDTGDTGVVSAPAFEMHLVDVGSGLAVVAAGDDFVMVVDGGSDDDADDGENNRLIAYLKAIRPALTHIDQLVLTHPHHDHMSLLPALFEHYAVDEVWDSGTPSPLSDYHAILTAVEASGAVYHSPIDDAGTHVIALNSPDDSYPEAVTLSHGARISAGMSVPLGEGAEMTFLFANETPDMDDFNLNSMVVRVDLAERRILLMGDAHGGPSAQTAEPPSPGSIEAQLLETPDAIDVDVLQVGDHGFPESNHRAFLDEVSPSISLIASYPVFSPPVQDVLDALSVYGPIFRTDADDDACRANSSKVGTGADGLPGGCDNILVTFAPDGTFTTEYFVPED